MTAWMQGRRERAGKDNMRIQNWAGGGETTLQSQGELGPRPAPSVHPPQPQSGCYLPASVRPR